jgi:glycosyltransferase involved in cell wall biosynthesis
LNEQEPLVSITTPTYNRARILVHKTLPSVISQTYHKFEWLIVGDHCTDNTSELLGQITDSRIRFHNLPTRPRYPRNKKKRWKIVGFKANTLAHEMAKGSWIAHLDDDDVFTPDHIQKLLAQAQAGNFEFVSGRSRIERRPGEWMEQGEPLSAEDGKLGHVSHSTVLYRSYLDSCFAYDPTCLKIDMAGDAYRWRRMMNAGVRVGFIRDVVTLLPLRPGEASRTIFQPD